VSIPALLGNKPRSTIRAWQRHSHERHRGRLTGSVEKPVAVPRTHQVCSPSYEHPCWQYYDTDVQFGRACKKGASVLYRSGNFSRMPWHPGCLVDVGGGFDRASDSSLSAVKVRDSRLSICCAQRPTSPSFTHVQDSMPLHTFPAGRYSTQPSMELRNTDIACSVSGRGEPKARPLTYRIPLLSPKRPRNPIKTYRQKSLHLSVSLWKR
jgi:hypothetical protein